MFYQLILDRQAATLGWNEGFTLVWLAGLMFSTCLYAMILIEHDELELIKIFENKQIEIMRRFTAWGLGLYLLVRLALHQIVITLIIIAGVCYLISSVAFFTVASLLMIISWFSLIGFYILIKRLDHWWCFSIILAVTATTAWLSRPYFSGGSLWLVALLVGCLSGIVAESCQRPIGNWLGNRVADLQISSDEQLRQKLGELWEQFHRIGNRNWRK